MRKLLIPLAVAVLCGSVFSSATPAQDPARPAPKPATQAPATQQQATANSPDQPMSLGDMRTVP
jgi:hypothetical protein